MKEIPDYRIGQEVSCMDFLGRTVKGRIIKVDPDREWIQIDSDVCGVFFATYSHPSFMEPNNSFTSR